MIRVPLQREQKDGLHNTQSCAQFYIKELLLSKNPPLNGFVPWLAIDNKTMESKKGSKWKLYSVRCVCIHICIGGHMLFAEFREDRRSKIKNNTALIWLYCVKKKNTLTNKFDNLS